MEVNLELFLLYNTCMDALILVLSAHALGFFAAKRQHMLPRIATASVFGAICTAVITATSLGGIIPLFAGWIITNLIAFGFESIRTFITTSAFTAIFALVVGGAGMVLLFNTGGVWTPLLAMVLSAAAIFTARGIMGIRRRAAQIPSMGTLTLTYGEPRKVNVLTAIVDSGNSLVEPVSGLPVIVVSCDTLSVNYDMPGFRIVPYHTVSGSGIMRCFKPASLFIDEKPLTAFVAVSEAPLRGAKALIPPAALIQSKGGRRYGIGL